MSNSFYCIKLNCTTEAVKYRERLFVIDSDKYNEYVIYIKNAMQANNAVMDEFSYTVSSIKYTITFSDITYAFFNNFRKITENEYKLLDELNCLNNDLVTVVDNFIIELLTKTETTVNAEKKILEKIKSNYTSDEDYNFSDNLVNCKIESISFNTDYNFYSFWIYLKRSDYGHQGYGGYSLGNVPDDKLNDNNITEDDITSNYGKACLFKIKNLFNITSLNELVGKVCRIHINDDGYIDSIGDIIENKWFSYKFTANEFKI